MRVAVVYFEEKYGELMRKTAESFAEGLESQNLSVDVINAKKFSSRLSGYQFIAFGTEPAGALGGKLPDGFVQFLKRSGTLIGIRTFAFMLKKGLRPGKSLLELMRVMESEGLFIVSSDVFSSSAGAVTSGKTLDLKSRFKA